MLAFRFASQTVEHRIQRSRGEEFPMTMQYAVRQLGDVTVLDLSGRMSLGDALVFGPETGAMPHELVRELATTGHKKILLNVGEVTYIDSSGLSELVVCMTTARNRGGQLRICNVNHRVNDLLRITRLDLVLNVNEDEMTAVQAFGSEQPKSAPAV